MEVPDAGMPEIDPNFEPQVRARSNTWPLRPKEIIKEEPESRTPTAEETSEVTNKDPLGLSKKTSSRRNAWGNLSYADLITKAIQSSPEQRLTLSQIYDWMVQNVPYFKDKGDSNSSAGWKNSIRHNLSLHSRFMRVQNEGTGKSSWWVINPDAKPGKSPRRRAGSMDTKAYEKKRVRVKKKVEAMRAAIENHGHSPNGGSEYDSELSLPDTFQLSPQDFRTRTSSNASSVGRLSPIPLETDLHDSQVPPMSPIPWNQQSGHSNTPYTKDGFTETISESLAEMFDSMNTLSPVENMINEPMSNSTLSTPSPIQPQMSPNAGNGIGGYQEQGTMMPAPPPYSEQMQASPQQHSPQSLMNNGSMGSNISNMVTMANSISTTMGSGGNMISTLTSGNAGMNSMDSGLSTTNGGQFLTQSLGELLQADMFPQNPIMRQEDPMLNAGVRTTMAMNQFPSAFHTNNTAKMRALSQMQQQQPSGMFPAQQQQQLLNNSLLRQALTQKQAVQQQLAASQQQQLSGGGLSHLGSTPMNNLPGLPGFPNDLDICDLKPSEFECDVQEIINHELSVDGSLDFNFEAIQGAQSADGQYGTIQT